MLRIYIDFLTDDEKPPSNWSFSYMAAWLIVLAFWGNGKLFVTMQIALSIKDTKLLNLKYTCIYNFVEDISYFTNYIFKYNSKRQRFEFKIPIY